MKPFFRSRKTATKKPQPWGLLPHAARYLILGHILILVALGAFASHLHSGSPEAILHLEDFMSSAVSAWVLMWFAGILMDYLERTIPSQSDG